VDRTKNISQFKRRWLTLGEAASALQTDDEGLLQAFESGAARELPVYVSSYRANFSALCTPIKFAQSLADNDGLRESMGDESGHIANDPRRKRTEEWERWFQLIGVFRIFPSTLRRIARERALLFCPVAPVSWWTAESPVSRSTSGNPKVRFEAYLYDHVSGERPVSFDSIRFGAEDIRKYGTGTESVEAGAPAGRFPPRIWPWGNHDTEALGYLAAAAEKWWSLYDANDPTTAPTNNNVAEWLIAEYNLSSQRAHAIASLLRADGLRNGPRK
jgi:hypothetical protein